MGKFKSVYNYYSPSAQFLDFGDLPPTFSVREFQTLVHIAIALKMGQRRPCGLDYFKRKIVVQYFLNFSDRAVCLCQTHEEVENQY